MQKIQVLCYLQIHFLLAIYTGGRARGALIVKSSYRISSNERHRCNKRSPLLSLMSWIVRTSHWKPPFPHFYWLLTSFPEFSPISPRREPWKQVSLTMSTQKCVFLPEFSFRPFCLLSLYIASVYLCRLSVVLIFSLFLFASYKGNI